MTSLVPLLTVNYQHEPYGRNWRLSTTWLPWYDCLFALWLCVSVITYMVNIHVDIDERYTISQEYYFRQGEISKLTFNKIIFQDESDKLPFPNDENDFTLPDIEFSDLLDERVKPDDKEEKESRARGRPPKKEDRDKDDG